MKHRETNAPVILTRKFGPSQWCKVRPMAAGLWDSARQRPFRAEYDSWIFKQQRSYERGRQAWAIVMGTVVRPNTLLRVVQSLWLSRVKEQTHTLMAFREITIGSQSQEIRDHDD